MLLKDRIAEFGLKPVGKREYEIFITSLMKGSVAKKVEYTKKLQEVKSELDIPVNWNLINYDFKA